MTDEEILQKHKEFQNIHRNAFRAAFDTLARLWPPKDDPEWFRDTAYPACAYHFCKPDADPLTKRLMLAVYGYLDEMAVKTRENKNA